MRLLNVSTFELESYHNPEDTPPYAILSHTWEDEEVLFDDLGSTAQTSQLGELEDRLHVLESLLRESTKGASGILKAPPRRTRLDRAKNKKGWMKVKGCCHAASKFGLEYVWMYMHHSH